MARDWFSEITALQGVDPNIVPVQDAAPKTRDWAGEIIGGGAPQSAKPDPAQGGNVFVRLGNMIKGNQDPAYANVPALDLQSPGTYVGAGASLKQEAAKYLGSDDKQYAEMLASGLGDKHKRTFQDANGYHIIEYIDDKENVKQGYVNKPGLDMADVGRVVKGAVPYILGGGAVAGAMRGAPMTARVMGQAGTAGITSIASDLGSTAAGAKFDGVETAKKAALTAAMGGLAEALPAKLTATMMGGAAGAYAQASPESTPGEYGMGTGLGAAAGYGAAALFKRMRMNPGTWIDATGKLTPAGEKLVVSQGLDPGVMSDMARREFAQTFATSRDATQAALRSQTIGEGVRASQGQITKDPTQLLWEKNARYGVHGKEAQDTMEKFYNEQSGDVSRLLRGDYNAAASGVPSKRPGLSETINPETWQSGSIADRGDAIRGGMRSAQEAMKAEEKQRWGLVGDLYPTPEAAASLPNFLSGAAKYGINEQKTPTTKMMLDTVEAWLAGKSTGGHPLLGNQQAQVPFDELRQQLGKMQRSVGQRDPGGPDAAAAKEVYNGVNKWVGQVNRDGLMIGPQSSVAAMDEARALTAERKGLFEPQGPAGNRLKSAVDPNNAPERVANDLIGNVSVRADPPAGSLQAITSMKRALTEKMLRVRAGSTAEAIANAQGAQQTWREIGSAYMDRIINPRVGTGGMNAAGGFADYQAYYAGVLRNMNAARDKQWSIMRELYPPDVLMQFERSRRTLAQIVSKDPNASGTATAGASIMKQAAEAALRSLSAVVTDSKLLGLGYQAGVKPIINKYNAGRAARAVDPRVKRDIPSFGPAGAVIGENLQ